MNSPKLSLCMTAFNQADMLPAFFKAVEGLFDELIVVDTGSTDETATLMQQAGAKVIAGTWQKDDAKARNAALDAATGTWVVFLSADEHPTAECVASIRHVSCQADVGAASLTLRHRLDLDQQATTYPVRMFRRDDKVRFVGAVAADIIEALLPQLDRTGQRLARLQGEAEHAGYAPEAMAVHNKQSASLHKFKAYTQNAPQDLYGWYKLLEHARFWTDIDAWTDAAYEADAIVSAKDDAEVLDAWYMGEMLVLMAEGMYAGDDSQLLYFLNPFETRIRPSAAYLLRRGELFEVTGEMGQAQADYLRCIDLRQVTPNAQLATVRPLLGLSRLSMARGDNATALELVDVALTESPRDPEALLALTTLTHALGGAETTARVVEAYIASHGDTTELRAALGEAALRAGDAAQAVTQLEQATSLSPGGRAQDLLAQARTAAATAP